MAARGSTAGQQRRGRGRAGEDELTRTPQLPARLATRFASSASSQWWQTVCWPRCCVRQSFSCSNSDGSVGWSGVLRPKSGAKDAASSLAGWVICQGSGQELRGSTCG